MLFLPIRTPLIQAGDDLAAIAAQEAAKQHPPGIQSGDIIVFSSKVVATAEGRIIHLSQVHPSPEALTLADACGKTASFCENALQEMQRMNGRLLGTCPGALFTEVRPEGLSQGTILIANAGLDDSNAPQGYAIGWPEDAAKSVAGLKKKLEILARTKDMGQRTMGSPTVVLSPKSLVPSLAVLLSDSCCLPRRQGVTAFALAVSGMDPLRSRIGEKDLYGKEMRVTWEAVADQLAVAANFLMGNVSESIPAVIVRDHGLALSAYEGWVPGIRAEEDLFGEMQ